jgi:ABC-type uncharacterized transport system permease subunit
MTEPAPVQPSDTVREVATAYRFVLIGVLAGLVCNIVIRGTTGGASTLIAVIALGIAVFTIVWTFRLAKALGRSPWLYAIGAIIPIVGLIVLVVLSQASQKYLKSQGVEVGFFGAKL